MVLVKPVFLERTLNLPNFVMLILCISFKQALGGGYRIVKGLGFPEPTVNMAMHRIKKLFL